VQSKQDPVAQDSRAISVTSISASVQIGRTVKFNTTVTWQTPAGHVVVPALPHTQLISRRAMVNDDSTVWSDLCRRKFRLVFSVAQSAKVCAEDDTYILNS
jgi:hypothetical protein